MIVFLHDYMADWELWLLPLPPQESIVLHQPENRSKFELKVQFQLNAFTFMMHAQHPKVEEL